MTLKVTALGTYDKGKPRTRILIRGLQENGVEVTECHQPVWTGIEDKSQIKGLGRKFKVSFSILAAYPRLAYRYMKLPRHDVVLIGYLGLFDLLFLWPVIKFRGVPIVWDVFISLYNTVVEDRALISKNNPVAWILYLTEWMAIRLADRVIMDTEAHAEYLRRTYNCTEDKVKSVFVGAEPEAFDLKALDTIEVDPDSRPIRVLFYGQFIPLHGIETVVQAAKLTERKDVQWTIIGKGQESNRIRTLISELNPSNINLVEWVEYKQLVKYLAQSHVALGIFGKTQKAQLVIPNKVFQIMLANRPLVTLDTPAMRELIPHSDDRVSLLPSADPALLAAEVFNIVDRTGKSPDFEGNSQVRDLIIPIQIGRRLLDIVKPLKLH
jgi:glycosyltransferase involved in cell wall biosynthesis